jgi:L-2,4-diaminobutyrate transaminase
VVTGFGRLGTMFGSDHYGIEADIITIAKGLTSAYAPLSGSIVSTGSGRCWNRAPTRFGPSATAGPIRPIRSGRRPESPT